MIKVESFAEEHIRTLQKNSKRDPALLEITPEECLIDTLETAKCIASRGKYKGEEYPLYVQAIRELRGHIYSENYSPEIAVARAAKTAYMAACLLKDTEYERVKDYHEFADKKFVGDDMKVFAYLKKANPEAYAYMIKQIC